MKVLILFLSCLCATSPLRAQERLTVTDALRQLYSGYDPDKSTAQWTCTKEQEMNGPHQGRPCWKEYATVRVTSVLLAEVAEDGTDKVYLVASAKPATSPENYDCHACAPAIGVAVFVAQEGNWALQSANPAVGFYGGWGSPPFVDLVKIGPDKRGVLLFDEDNHGGFASSYKILLVPFGRTVAEAWGIQDEQDNTGAYDPTDKLNKQVPYRSAAAFRFNTTHSDEGSNADYYDVELISRGDVSNDLVHLKPENWTEVYRFKDGKYRLLSHKNSIEIAIPHHQPQKRPKPKPTDP